MPALNARATPAMATEAERADGMRSFRLPYFSQSGRDMTIPSPCARAKTAASATESFSSKPHMIKIAAP